MSLKLTNKKQKDLIPIGRCKDDYIYYETGVPKAERVKHLSLEHEIEPIPYLDLKAKQRSANFISGISGSGKSTLAVKLIKELRALRKDKDRAVVIFTSSSLDNADPAFEKLKMVDIVPFDHEEFTMITIDMLKDCIVVFDDWEVFKDKALETYVLTFMKDVLERSRKLGVDIIIINHMTMNYNKTRNIIFECDNYFLNIGMNKNSSRKFLESYMDIGKKELKNIVEYEADSQFSWSMFRKSAPSLYIQDCVVKLL